MQDVTGFLAFSYQAWISRLRCRSGVILVVNMRRMTDANSPRVYTARGPAEGEDWAAVAAVVNERMAARRVGQQELAHLSGVSVSTLRQVQHGAGRRVQNKTLAAISRALGWPDDHLATVLLSRREIPSADAMSPEDSTAAVLRRIDGVREISERLAALEAALAREDAQGRGA
jgi:DNA-binding Xre family transcriptional regulator